MRFLLLHHFKRKKGKIQEVFEGTVENPAEKEKMKEILAFWGKIRYNKLIHFTYLYEVLLCI